MESQNSSGQPPHLHHHHHQPPPNAVIVTPYTQTHHNNPYPPPNNNNSVNPNVSNATIVQQQNPRFPFNPMATAAAVNPSLDHHYSDGSPSGGAAGVVGFSIEPSRKKRGRPRKYSPDNSIGLGLSPGPGSQVPSIIDHNHSGSGATPSSDNPAKKHRGRPPGSGKKQLDALGVPGVGFTPHVITVNVGEDIASKIMAFSQQGPRTVCILSANGAVCNCTLRQASMSGGTVSYEGRFDIISLSGSFQLSEIKGNSTRTGGLSVSLAGSDGRVLGGGVAGMLKAATPVQVIVSSFIPDAKKSKPSTGSSSSTPPLHMLNSGTPETGASPSAAGNSSDSGEENDGSPPDLGPGRFGNVGQPIPSMPMYSNMGWPN